MTVIKDRLEKIATASSVSQFIVNFEDSIHVYESISFGNTNYNWTDWIKEKLSSDECVDPTHIKLNFINIVDAYSMESACVYITATIQGGLAGGKGGFGAQLRSQAKKKGSKQTTNYGACRDLSGRRLRHINNEIILKKWKEAKDRGETFSTDEETPSGINLWFLSAPSWADGVKVSKMKKFLKTKYKSSICRDWLNARESRRAPDGSPPWWGCPRGRKCEFAHGEEDLVGKQRQHLLEEKQYQKVQESNLKKQSYMQPLENTLPDDEVASMVKHGFHVVKKARVETNEPIVTLFIDNTLPDSIFSVPEVNILSGSMIVEKCDLGFALSSNSKFATMMINIPVTDHFYYEVELLSDGLLQIGWIDEDFCGDSDSGDGVGDDSHSWSFDGLRKKFIHMSKESDILGYSDDSIEWSAGDIVGCFIKFERVLDKESESIATMKFSLNGRFLGEMTSTSTSSALYPAISMDEFEEALVNYGNSAFRYEMSTSPIASSSGSMEICNNSMKVDESEKKCPIITESSISFERIDLESINFQSVESLEVLGLERLKFELQQRGLKVGGTLRERAQRLWSVKGLEPEQIDKKLRSQNSQSQK